MECVLSKLVAHAARNNLLIKMGENGMKTIPTNASARKREILYLEPKGERAVRHKHHASHLQPWDPVRRDPRLCEWEHEGREPRPRLWRPRLLEL
jgi:hypothetical protein